MALRLATVLSALLLASGGVWAAGFAVFCHDARTKARPPPVADGIVALTGGADRVDTALRLLADGRAPLLLVSGVGRGAELGEMLRHAATGGGATGSGAAGGGTAAAATLDGRVTLGRVAATTVGNAQETAAWATEHGMRSLIVVTAGYHMARALLELHRALPGVILYASPVQPPALRTAMGVGTVRLLATEYDKLLAVRLAGRLNLGRQLMEAWGS